MKFESGDIVKIRSPYWAEFAERAEGEESYFATAEYKIVGWYDDVIEMLDLADPDSGTWEAYEKEIEIAYPPVTTEELQATFRSLLGRTADHGTQ